MCLEIIVLLPSCLGTAGCCGVGARLWVDGFGDCEGFQGYGSYRLSTRVGIALELNAEQDVLGI